MITSQDLKLLAPSIPQSRCITISFEINKICPLYGINEPDIFHEFIANVLEETGEFQTFEENLNYSVEGLIKTFSRERISLEDCQRYGRTGKQKADKQVIANLIYGGQWGKKNLGNTELHDGWDFRGSGAIQLTGRGNITKFATYYNKIMRTNYSALEMADLLRSDLSVAIHSACWCFAVMFQLIDEAIDDKMKEIVKRINGGYLNMDKRTAYYKKAQELIK